MRQKHAQLNTDQTYEKGRNFPASKLDDRAAERKPEKNRILFIHENANFGEVAPRALAALLKDKGSQAEICSFDEFEKVTSDFDLVVFCNYLNVQGRIAKIVPALKKKNPSVKTVVLTVLRDPERIEGVDVIINKLTNEPDALLVNLSRMLRKGKIETMSVLVFRPYVTEEDGFESVLWEMTEPKPQFETVAHDVFELRRQILTGNYDAVFITDSPPSGRANDREGLIQKVQQIRKLSDLPIILAATIPLDVPDEIKNKVIVLGKPYSLKEAFAVIEKAVNIKHT